MSDDASYLQRVRESCIALETAEARVDLAAAEAFAKSLDIDRIKQLGSNLSNLHEHDVVGSNTFFNVTFPNAEAEVNMIAVAHALDFGSGFRYALHEHTGKGAWLSVKDGLENMYRENPALSAEWLANLTEADIARMYNLSATKADGTPTGLALLIKHLTNVSNELGRELQKRGYSCMGDLVLKVVREKGTAAGLVRELVETFPLTFNDVHTYKGQTVYLYKKAQLVTGELHHRFANELPGFDFPDSALMTAFVDNVICATMRKTGVVVCSEGMTRAIENRELLPSGGAYEVSFRAKALHGVELLVQLTDNKLMAIELGNYLWAVLGKQPDFRKYERHATQDTVFY